MSTSHTHQADLSASFASQEESTPELLSSIEGAVEQERYRIAADLHDSIAQDVALALHKLEYIQHLLEQSQLYQAFQEVTHVARILENGLDDLHSSIDGLLPRQFDPLVAFSSLTALIQEYRQDHPELQLDCQFEPHELLTDIPVWLEIPIFRFVQQALNNVWQHAAASHIMLSLVLIADILTVAVSDNGTGREENQEGSKPLASGAGLRIMRERVEHAGGIWEIKSQPGGGTSIRALFSLHKI